ncbi:MAG: hypothetical protein LBN23_03420 [Paludibacter sp.]|jgi:hypothetical protein|nr:hypothetical protein [Paludibacter sp.]
MTVKFDPYISDFIGTYFENYVSENGHNDLSERVLRVRRIREFLSTFDLSGTYVIDNKKYVKIPNIAIIEYITRNNQTEILVNNIYFID